MPIVIKDRGKKLTFGPMWDFDMSLGNTLGIMDNNPTGWWARDKGPWAQRMFTDQTLVDSFNTRYVELRERLGEIAVEMEATGIALESAIDNDEVRWRYTELPAQDTPQHLRQWFEARLNWIDSQVAVDHD